MANNCDTTYRICGEPKKVTKLWNALSELGADKKDVWLDSLADYFNIDYQKRYISVRGHIYYANVEVKEDDYMELQVETDTAWSGCHDLFYAISEKIGNVSISYREIEPGCEIFAVHDEGAFFLEECCVSCDGANFESMYGEPFEKVEGAIKYWCETMGIQQGDRDEDEMLEYISNYKYEDDNVYFYIYKFSFE